jgi:hypothetical protein
LFVAAPVQAGTNVSTQISVDGFAVAQGFEITRTATTEEMWFQGPLTLTPFFLQSSSYKTEKDVPDKLTLSGKVEMIASSANFSVDPKEEVIQEGTVTVKEITLIRQKDGGWVVSPEDAKRTLRLLREASKKKP